MKNRIKYVASLSLTTAIAALPLLAGAVPSVPVPGAPLTTPGPFTDLPSLTSFICLVVYGWLFVFLIVLSVIFAMVAAYKYLTAGGDPEKVKSASNILIYAAIAIVVALFARGLPTLIYSLVGGGGATAAC